MTDHLDVGAVLDRLRRTIRRRPTDLEARDHFAGWWEALHAELAEARREQVAGVLLSRVSAEDVEHARRMAAWARHSAADLAWQEQPDNVHALREWQRVRPKDDDQHDAKAIYAALPERVRACLALRPRAPDRRDIPLARPSQHMPPRWPPIRPGVLWSEYLRELLSEFRRIAGVEEDED